MSSKTITITHRLYALRLHSRPKSKLISPFQSRNSDYLHHTPSRKKYRRSKSTATDRVYGDTRFYHQKDNLFFFRLLPHFPQSYILNSQTISRIISTENSHRWRLAFTLGRLNLLDLFPTRECSDLVTLHRFYLYSVPRWPSAHNACCYCYSFWTKMWNVAAECWRHATVGATTTVQIFEQTKITTDSYMTVRTVITTIWDVHVCTEGAGGTGRFFAKYRCAKTVKTDCGRRKRF